MAGGNRALPRLPRLDPMLRSLRQASPPEQWSRAQAARPGPSASRPAWTLLYALLPLCAALFALIEEIPPTGLRTLAQGVAVVLVIGLAAVWVHANRPALSRMPSDPEWKAGPSGITVEIHTASPRVIHLEPRRSRVEG